MYLVESSEQIVIQNKFETKKTTLKQKGRKWLFPLKRIPSFR